VSLQLKIGGENVLTDLSFLNVGEVFPPVGENERLQLYRTNRELFKGNHTEVFKDQFKRIQRVIGNFDQVISYETLINYHKLVSVKTADLLLGEFPRIVAGEEDSPEQKAVSKIIQNTDLINTAYQVALDVSRFGDGLFQVYKEGNKGFIDISQPCYWFPVVKPDNVKRIQHNVLAYTYEYNDESYLKVQIHSKGSYEENLYRLEKGMTNYTIKGLISTNTYKTGLNDFAVIQVPNLTTSDTIFGMDDYLDLNTIISELEVRVSQVAKILDKHSDPSLEGSINALEQDPHTGEWKLKLGNFIVRDKEEPETKYLTWDGQLEANFKFIDKLINILYTVSEMGSAVFGDLTGSKASGGNVMSGNALKKLMISPLAKVRRIAMRFETALKKSIVLCSQLGGEGIVDLSNTNISIYWNDGLPIDTKEQADEMAIRTGNKPTISRITAIKQMNNLSDKDAQIELDRIDEDEAKMNPIGGQNFPSGSQNIDE